MNHLNSMHLAHFVNVDTNIAAALAKVYKHILSLSGEGLVTHCSDAHKI